jgi:hypothetical protein
MKGIELKELAHRLFWINYEDWEKGFVKAGSSKEMAQHLWDKWKVEHQDNFLWAFGNFDSHNQEIVAGFLS